MKPQGRRESFKKGLPMSTNPLIALTDRTWNPVRRCTKISSDCYYCYLEEYAHRLRMPGSNFERGFEVHLPFDELLKPLSWREPSIVSVNSMSDLFHDDVPDSYIVEVFYIMATVDWHVYLVSTKHPERMQRMIADQLQFASKLEHIWRGTKVENREQGLPLINTLRNSDIPRRFLSCEPLLDDLGTVNLDGIEWVIAGGENGRKARRIKKEWLISLRDQCDAAKVPFFFKQWGGFPKAKYGCLLDGNQYQAVPPLQTGVVRSLSLCRNMKAALRVRSISSLPLFA